MEEDGFQIYSTQEVAPRKRQIGIIVFLLPDQARDFSRDVLLGNATTDPHYAVKAVGSNRLLYRKMDGERITGQLYDLPPEEFASFVVNATDSYISVSKLSLSNGKVAMGLFCN